MYPPLCSETKWTSLIAYDFLSVGCRESGTRTTGVIILSYSKTPITRILVLLTLLGCHPISSSCCIRVKTLKLTLVTIKGNLILIGETNRSRVIIKMPYHVTVFDERSKFALHQSLNCWEISNYQFSTWQIEFVSWPQWLEPSLTRTVFRFPFELELPGFYCSSFSSHVRITNLSIIRLIVRLNLAADPELPYS